MKKPVGERHLFLFFLILILINIALISFFFKRWLIYKRNPSSSFFNPTDNSLYNRPCPPLELVDLTNDNINLEPLQSYQ